MDPSQLARVIDHTLLKPDATKADIDQLLEEAMTHHFYSVCVHPYWVPYCKAQLQDSSIQVCTVIGFPLGATTTETKVFETKQAIELGATEVDMVINIGELKAGHDAAVEQDIAAVVSAANGQAIVKVILETALLTDEEIVRACQIAKAAQADFVKTSTGFSTGGATEDHVKLMRQTVGDELGVKASGGIRDQETARKMLAAGANRIGASASVKIVSS